MFTDVKKIGDGYQFQTKAQVHKEMNVSYVLCITLIKTLYPYIVIILYLYSILGT